MISVFHPLHYRQPFQNVVGVVDKLCLPFQRSTDHLNHRSHNVQADKGDVVKVQAYFVTLTRPKMR